MVLVVGVLVVIVVFVIAAVVLGRETARLGHQPKATIVDVEEAVAHVAEHLDETHASRLTHDEVRQIVGWYFEHLRRKGVSAPPGRELPASTTPGAVVIDDDAVAAALERVDERALDLTDDNVLAVVDLIVDYLDEVGAVGPAVDGPPDPFTET